MLGRLLVPSEVLASLFLAWIAFRALVLAMLATDRVVFHRTLPKPLVATR